MAFTNRIFDYENFFANGQMQIPAGEIFQVSELALIKGGEMEEHIQFCDEITLAISGSATIYCGDTSFKMNAGQIHFGKAGLPHRIVASPSSNFHYCCIGFFLNANHESTKAFYQSIQKNPNFLVDDQGSIQTLFRLLSNECYIRDGESNIMIHYFFCQILILLHRILNGQADEQLGKTSRASFNHAVYRTLKYIDNHYMELTSVKEISKSLSYSEYYLSHVFSEKMGITIKEYLLRKKIMTAAELLKQNTMSIGEIAELLHFNSSHSFGAAFKRYLNMSACEFRDQAKKQQTSRK